MDQLSGSPHGQSASAENDHNSHSKYPLGTIFDTKCTPTQFTTIIVWSRLKNGHRICATAMVLVFISKIY